MNSARRELRLPEDGRILYFVRDREQFRFLSHFYPSAIELDGAIWPTVEHFYQAQKSANPAYIESIRSASSPGQAKRLAAPPTAPRRFSKDSWFKANGEQPRPDWHLVKLDIMRRADQAKYAQHTDLAMRLIATGQAVLVEDNPNEPFWGTGPDGLGANWAGRVLMEIREMLASAATL